MKHAFVSASFRNLQTDILDSGADPDITVLLVVTLGLFVSEAPCPDGQTESVPRPGVEELSAESYGETLT